MTSDQHFNSFNALQSAWSSSHPLMPLMDMLAHIGYVLSDILKVLEDKKVDA